MADRTLKNVSERIFIIAGEKRVEPGQVFTTDPATANLLMELYSGELMDLAAEAANLEQAAAAGQSGTAAVNLNEMTVKDLRAYLKEKGISFAAGASKAELLALASGSAGETSTPATGSAAPAVAPTVLTDDAKLEEGVVYVDTNGALFVGALNGADVGLLPVDQLTADERAALVAEGKLTA